MLFVTPIDIMIIIFLSSIAGFMLAEALTLLEVQHDET